MQGLEKRIALLEAEVTHDNDAIRVIYQCDGETFEQAKAREGVANDWPGQVIFVQFVSAGSVNAERPSTPNE